MTTHEQYPQLSTRSSTTGEGHWYGDARRPGFAWVAAAASTDRRSGVLILPPLAYEYWTTHHSLLALQERLVSDGHLVMRVDYTGTGDAAGELQDEACLALWKQEVASAVAQLRQWGAQDITLVGVRFGASLAMQWAQALGVQQVVAWLPIVSGRRYVREIRLMALQVPADTPADVMASGCFVGGVVLTEALLADIGQLNLDTVSLSCKLLLIDRDGMPSAANLADKCRTQCADVEYMLVSDAPTMLDMSTEEAGIAIESVQAICHRLKLTSEVGAANAALGLPTLTSAATWSANGGMLSERHFRFTDMNLSAIETTPVGFRSGVTVVFLNSGSEKHVGAGRSWVEFARGLTSRGHASVRVDFQGWGESPDNGYRPGRPYDLHGVTDTQQIVNALREQGHHNIVLVGVCAGAWIALRECQSLQVQGIVAFNPQLYFMSSDPVPPTMNVLLVWYSEERAKDAWQTRRESVTRWMQKIKLLPYPVDFWFEQDDRGMDYLQDQVPASMEELRAESMLSINTFPGLDHSMHRRWLRHEALDAIDHLISRMGIAAK